MSKKPYMCLIEEETVVTHKTTKHTIYSIDECIRHLQDHKYMYSNTTPDDNEPAPYTCNSIVIRGQSHDDFDDILEKLPASVTKMTLDNQLINSDMAINVVQLKHLTLKNMPLSILNLETPNLTHLIINNCLKLTNCDVIQNLSQLEHLEITKNKHISNIVLPGSIKYAKFTQTPMLSTIKADSASGLLNIHTLIVTSKVCGQNTKPLLEIPLDMPQLKHLELESTYKQPPYPTSFISKTTKKTTPNTTADSTSIISDDNNIVDTGVLNGSTCDVVFDLPNSLANLATLALIGFENITVPDDLSTDADLIYLKLMSVGSQNGVINGNYPRLADVIISFADVRIVDGLVAPNVVSVTLYENYNVTCDWLSKWLDHDHVIEIDIIDNFLTNNIVDGNPIPLKLNMLRCMKCMVQLPKITHIDLAILLNLKYLYFKSMHFCIQNNSQSYNSLALFIYLSGSSISNNPFKKYKYSQSYGYSTTNNLLYCVRLPIRLKSTQKRKATIYGKPRSKYM